MNLGELLLTSLKNHGAHEIFGIPGDFILPFFKVIENSAILPLYTMSHEPGIGFAADAAARFYGHGLGVVAATYGAGGFNLVNVAAGAYAEKSPLVILAGGPSAAETQNGLLLHHQAKTLEGQLNVYKEVTCDQVRLDDPATAPALIERALRNCRELSRPVYIEIPRDLPTMDATPIESTTTPFDSTAVAACADDILAGLKNASAPIILAGVEVRRFGLEDKLATLASSLNIPIATTFMGQGLFADGDTPLVGPYMGLAGNPAITELVENADNQLLLGVILSDTNFGVSARSIDLRHATLASDRRVQIGHRGYSNIPLAALIDALTERASQHNTRSTPARIGDYPRGLIADDTQVTPPDIVRAVNDLFDKHGVMPIASDTGDCLFTATEIGPTQLVGPGYYSGMGFGVPAGLGLQVASGERPIIMVGDGAFQMTGMELGNCARYGWDPIVIVFNNASWEMLRTFQPEGGYNSLAEWQFAKIADALGGIGHRVSTRQQLADTLESAVTTRGKFQLIEVMIERGAISDTLKRFVNTVRKLSMPSQES